MGGQARGTSAGREAHLGTITYRSRTDNTNPVTGGAPRAGLPPRSAGRPPTALRNSAAVSRAGSRASAALPASTASGSLRSRRPSHPAVRTASSSCSGSSAASSLSSGHATARSARAAASIRARASASGRPSSTTRSARERNASSTAARKFVVVTTTAPGTVAARWSRPASTASVARCTSTGFVSNDARPRRTAKLSTSSISTTTCGRAAASAGTTSRSSLVTFRWLSPSISLGRACGSISRNVVAPRAATARAAAWASPRASVVLPVPGGPASTISPLGGAGSAARRRPCIIATSAVPSSRSLVPSGTTMLSHGPS